MRLFCPFPGVSSISVTCIYGKQCKEVERGVGEAIFIYEIKIQKCQKMKLLWRVSKFQCHNSDSYSWFSVCIATNIEGQLIFLYFISDLEPDLTKSS
jgi:hypothetical protein